MFKEGDLVVCVDDTPIGPSSSRPRVTSGHEYEVIAHSEGYDRVPAVKVRNDIGRRQWVFAEKFIKVPSAVVEVTY